MYSVERTAYRNATIVSTLTHGMLRRILEKNVPPHKVELFEPSANESLLEINQKDGQTFRSTYGLDGKFILSHSGNMGVKQGLEVILETALLCKGDLSMVFLIVGDGAMRNRIRQRAVDLGLENVRFMPLLETSEFKGFLAASDICLVTQLKAVSDIVFPSKTVTYMAAARPIIASVNRNSEIAQVIEESGAGRVIDPEDPTALSNAIYELRSEKLDDYGLRGREYAHRRWSGQRVLGHLERTLMAVSGMAARGAKERLHNR